MKIKYIMGSLLVIIGFTLTLAGCTKRPSAFTDKRIERAKLVNDINANKEVAKEKNDEINKAVSSELKSNVEARMKEDCSPGQLDYLAKSESCYVDKLKAIKDANDHKAMPMARTACYKQAFEEKISGSKCGAAIKLLNEALMPHEVLNP